MVGIHPCHLAEDSLGLQDFDGGQLFATLVRV